MSKNLEESAPKHAETAPINLGDTHILNDTKFWVDKEVNKVNWVCYETLITRFPDDPWYVTEFCDWNNAEHLCVDSTVRYHSISYEWRHHVSIGGYRNWPFSCSPIFAENYFGLDCSKWRNRVKLGL